MSNESDGDLGNFSMMELFRIEVEGQASILSDSLLELENSPAPGKHLESAMRAAHSIKGAARMVDIDVAVRVAHVMEDCFVAAQEQQLTLSEECIDALLKGMDILVQISQLNANESENWFSEQAQHIEAVVNLIMGFISQKNTDADSAESVETKPDTTAPTSAEEKTTSPEDYRMPETDQTMLGLFRTEVEIHGETLGKALLELEASPENEEALEQLMRAAHSIKGAARVIDLNPVVEIAHVMEDGFVAGQEKKVTFRSEMVDALLKGVDIIKDISDSTEEGNTYWFESSKNIGLFNKTTNLLSKIVSGGFPDTVDEQDADKGSAAEAEVTEVAVPSKQGKSRGNQTAIKISIAALNKLMGLAGESIIESRRLRPYADSMLTLKRRQLELIELMDKLYESVMTDTANKDLILEMLLGARDKADLVRNLLIGKLDQLEEFDRSFNSLSTRLNREVINSRMRPFSDGVHGFQRMVRDISRSLGKNVKLTIHGLNTQVDRDILEKIEAPLNHLLRNSIDHGIESPEERESSGKNPEGHIQITAAHNSGMLSITVQDDGKGIDLEKLKNKTVTKGLVTEEMAKSLSEHELLEFLFLPSFSTKDEVTEVSGRGVGLDVVQSVVHEMRGLVRTSTELGKGIKFNLQLPLTLSVIRALIVEVAGEPYAFPLARILKTLKIHPESIETLEGRQYFTLGNQHIGIVAANHVLGIDQPPLPHEELSVIVVGEKLNTYGMVVDKFLGERSLVVQTLDQRLGKIQDIGAAAILDDGNPVLIVDVEDMMRSIDLLISGGRIANVESKAAEKTSTSTKRILIVDDSITVREVERNMLETKGYAVEVAVDGVDGWNAVRTNNYDLVISDIDMPRMNGFELVGMIKQDKALGDTPVMIVSYKDREEDRLRGLDAGADYYLTKGSFHDETLLNAVEDLIGKP